MKTLNWSGAALVYLCVAADPATATTLTFDTLADGDAVVDQFAGVHFAGATVLTAGVSLNDLEFPPHSGSNVVFDSGGPISISFDTPLATFGGFATYQVPVTLHLAIEAARPTSSFNSRRRLEFRRSS